MAPVHADFTVSSALTLFEIVDGYDADGSKTIDLASSNSTYPLIIKVNEGASNSATWKTSSAKIATVDEDGLVKGVGIGTVTITATSADGSKKGMSKRTTIIMPGTEKILSQMGEQIKLARLRRQIPVDLVAERAGISRATLWAVEKGTPTVAMGTYAAVLHALNGLDRDLLLIAKDDELGRKFQDLNLLTRKRAPKTKQNHEE